VDEVTTGIDENKWALSYADDPGLGWPCETLIRVLKGDYVPGLDRDYAGKKVLDVSCGNGNNLAFLASLGLELYGTEVHDDILVSVREKLARLGTKADLRAGTNRDLPFGNDQFDLLVSWNVIHYETTEIDIRRALSEYHRVLRPGGRFVVSTTGPDHKILQGCEALGEHRYRIGRKDDFRCGEILYCFDEPAHIMECFSPPFLDVLVGRTHDFLFSATLDWFIVTGRKG